MTAESLWDLFVRTGLPEAYSLYHQTISGAARDPFGLPHRDSLSAHPESYPHGEITKRGL